MQTETQIDPFELFQTELPDLADAFDSLVEAQIAHEGLDPRTKQLVNIAIQTANRNPRGVLWHAMMAHQGGASREEILAAVAMNLHLSGLAVVLESLPAAVRGIEMATAQQG